MIVVVIGVCGCGKTTIGQALANKLGVSFRDADEFHSKENKDKMASNIPLTDEDRFPWLLAIHKYIKDLVQDNVSGVVTCSALKKLYRNILLQGTQLEPDLTRIMREKVLFVLLKGNVETIKTRLCSRKGHFMPVSMLESQLSIIEVPDNTENHIIQDIEKPVVDVVEELYKQII